MYSTIGNDKVTQAASFKSKFRWASMFALALTAVALVPSTARADGRGTVGMYQVELLPNSTGFNFNIGVPICPTLADPWQQMNGSVYQPSYSADQVKAMLATVVAAKLVGSTVYVWTDPTLVPGVCTVTKIWVQN